MPFGRKTDLFLDRCCLLSWKRRQNIILMWHLSACFCAQLSFTLSQSFQGSSVQGQWRNFWAQKPFCLNQSLEIASNILIQQKTLVKKGRHGVISCNNNIRNCFNTEHYDDTENKRQIVTVAVVVTGRGFDACWCELPWHKSCSGTLEELPICCLAIFRSRYVARGAIEQIRISLLKLCHMFKKSFSAGSCQITFWSLCCQGWSISRETMNWTF